MHARTVLVVDDDPDHQTVCGVLLQHAGYRVLQALDGAEGVRLARDARPDVVLMDVRMPRMDGITARRELAERPETRGIPVIAITADVLKWPEERVLDEGFSALLPKPCNLRRILSVVGGLVPAAEGELVAPA
jgi:two-component system cell cycle response regulator DivK